MEYETRITKVIVLPKNQRIFSEQATTIEIDDEAAGEFIKIAQDGQTVKFDVDEWEIVKREVDKMAANCRDYEYKNDL